MIPTSFSGSSPPTAGSLLGLANNNTSPFPPGSTAAGGGSSDNKEVYDSALLGIASLILEGRALAEDEYAVRQPDVLTQVGPGVCGGANTMADGSIGGAGRHSPKPSTSRAGNSIYQQEHHSHHHHGSSGGGGGGSGAGNHSNSSSLKSSHTHSSASSSIYKLNSIEEIDLIIKEKSLTKTLQATSSKCFVTIRKIRKLGKYFPVVNFS
uniref:Cyclin-dependent kinase 2-associated protein n=1 Tax=Musca domestica TaxID=7370 RepID=T1PJY4_MUSDO